MRDCSLLRRLEQDQNKCPLYGIVGCPLLRGLNILKSTEIQSGHSELSIMSQVSAVEGCPLSGIPLYIILILTSSILCLVYTTGSAFDLYGFHTTIINNNFCSEIRI